MTNEKKLVDEILELRGKLRQVNHLIKIDGKDA